MSSLDLIAELDELDGGDDSELDDELEASFSGAAAADKGKKRTRSEMEGDEEGNDGEEGNGEGADEFDEDMEEDEETRKKRVEEELAAKLKGAEDVKTVAKLWNSKGFQDTLKVRSRKSPMMSRACLMYVSLGLLAENGALQSHPTTSRAQHGSGRR